MWEQLDEVSLRDVFAQDVVTTIDPPLVIRQDYIHLQGYALQRFYDTHNDENFTERDQERALKLHLLLSRMLLERIEEHGEEGKAFFQARVRRLYRGDWLGLLRDAQHRATTRPAQRPAAPRPAARADRSFGGCAASTAAREAEMERRARRRNQNRST